MSRQKSRDGNTTNASLSTDFFHRQLIQIRHNRVRWLSRRVPIPYRISGIWSSYFFISVMVISWTMNVFSVNLALNQPAVQSSTYYDVNLQYSASASLSVDGNKDTNFYHKNCSATNDGPGGANWWVVDLGREYDIHHVVLTNRIEMPTGIQVLQFRIVDRVQYNQFSLLNLLNQ